MSLTGMNRSRIAFIVSAAMALVLLIGLPALFDALREKKNRKDGEMSSFLSGPLKERMELDSNILAASVSLTETGSGKTPHSCLLARIGKNGELREDPYDIDRVPVLPAGMMQAPTLTFFLDKKYIHLEDRIPTCHGTIPVLRDNGVNSKDQHILSFETTTGKDSISVKEGFLMSSRYVAARIALDNENIWQEYLDKFVDFFGSSEAYYIPRIWDRYLFRKEYASIADGHGLHLSQGQIITFYDALANGGVRARHRYLRKRSICTAQTARAMGDLLRENVLSGTGILLSSHPAHIAGKTGSGTLTHGFVPGIVRSAVPDSVTVASFVGFFPAESPLYTMCVSFYYNADGFPASPATPVQVFGKIVDKMMEEGMLWKK